MNFTKKNWFHASVIALFSIFYAIVFIVSSNSIEFTRLLDHATTLNSGFWNNWSDFLKQGNLQYIGYLYILFAVLIVIFSIVKRRDYDEYQRSLLGKGILASGIAMMLLLPLCLLLVLSDKNYSVEFILFLIVAHWSILLIADLVFVIRWCRD